MLFCVHHASGQNLVRHPHGCDMQIADNSRNPRAPNRIRNAPSACGAANFDTITFDQRFSFNHVTFVSTASFRNAAFFPLGELVDFSSAVFSDASFFSGSTFAHETHFNDATFNGPVQFLKATFREEATFRESTFNEPAVFSQASFDHRSNFWGAIFDTTVFFQDVTFDSLADFTNTTFGNKADFSRAHFLGNVEFRNTEFPDSLDFRDVATVDDIDLTYGEVRSPDERTTRTLIALEGTDISKVKINMELFQLWFPGLEDAPEKKIDIYEDVLREFEQDGLRNSYEVLDIEYRSFVNQYKGHHFADFFNKYWWNYGYSKEWIVRWSVAWFVLFTLLNTLLFSALMKSVYTIPQLQVGKGVFSIEVSRFPGGLKWLIQGINFILGLLKHVVLSIYYTSFVFFGVRMNFDKLHRPESTTAFVLMGYLFVVYMIGLFCTGYLVAIVFIA